MKKEMWILIVLYFIQGIVTNMHHPLMPYYVRWLMLPEVMFGVFFSLMNFGTMLGGPFWGNLGDHGKKKISVILGLAIYAIGQIFFGMGHIFNEWFLSFFRLLSGFGIAAAITIIMSEIVHVSNNRNKGRNIAFGAASLALGGAIGYYFGGFIHTNSFIISIFKTDIFQNALLMQGILVLFLAFLVFLFFKPHEADNKNLQKRPQFWEGFKEIKNINKETFFFLLSLVVITIAATNIDKYIDVFISDLGYNAAVVGQFKMIVGLVSIATGIILVPMLMKIKRKLTFMTILQILSAIIIFFVFSVDKNMFLIVLYSVFMLYIIIKSIYGPLEQDYIIRYAKEGKVSTIIGIRQAFFSIGTIIGPLIGALIYEKNHKILFYSSGFIFILSVIFIYLSYIFSKKSHEIT